MADFPAMPLWTDAYLGDTHHLTLEHHGAYLKLLMIAWRSRDCALPDDDEQLATILGVTVQRWRKKLRPVIEPFWIIDGGRWIQKKQQKVRKNVEKVSSARREAYEKTQRAKRLKNNDTGGSNGSSNDQANDQSLDNLTKTKTKKDSESHSGDSEKSGTHKNTGQGSNARSLSPVGSGSDPPEPEPDPDRFLMTMSWTMDGEFQAMLEAEFMPELGTEPFWRQIERFMEEHVKRGTLDTQQGFQRSLENWLKRANANREKVAFG